MNFSGASTPQAWFCFLTFMSPYWHFNLLGQPSPTFLAPETSFMEDNFSMDQDQVGEMVWGWFQVHYTYCTLYFYYYYISPTAEHQVLDPGGWGPLF